MNFEEIKHYLAKEDIDKINLMGIFGVLIIKKNILKKNSDVGEFIEVTLGKKFPEYVIKSRTLMSARVNRILLNEEDDIALENIWKNILNYLQKQEERIDLKENTYKMQKKKNENDKIKKWLKGL